jgi:hypothetical protein
MSPATLTSFARATALVVLASSPLQAQRIADRVERTRDGDVRFSFTVREGICGRGQNIQFGDRHQMNWNDNSRSSRDVEYDRSCDEGPGRVVVAVRDGEVAELRFYVGGRWRESSSASDVGMVGTREAAAFLLELAESHPGKVGRTAIFPATLVDSVRVYPTLLRIARDERRPRETRNQAVFWLGQLAEEPATAGLDELVGQSDIDREVRKQAIFALSQRREEGIPVLIRIVRTNRDPELRRQALFWLAQTNDPRAVDLIEELLTKR